MTSENDARIKESRKNQYALGKTGAAAKKCVGRRRLRTSFSPAQLDLLEEMFHVTHYPSEEMRTKLRISTGIPEGKIQIWFQNRRAKWRRYERLGNFGGLQEMKDTDIIPAPKTTIYRAEQTADGVNKMSWIVKDSHLPSRTLSFASQVPPHNSQCDIITQHSLQQVGPERDITAAHLTGPSQLKVPTTSVYQRNSIAELRRRAQEYKAMSGH